MYKTFNNIIHNIQSSLSKKIKKDKDDAICRQTTSSTFNIDEFKDPPMNVDDNEF